MDLFKHYILPYYPVSETITQWQHVCVVTAATAEVSIQLNVSSKEGANNNTFKILFFFWLSLILYTVSH